MAHLKKRQMWTRNRGESLRRRTESERSAAAAVSAPPALLGFPPDTCDLHVLLHTLIARLQGCRCSLEFVTNRMIPTCGGKIRLKSPYFLSENRAPAKNQCMAVCQNPIPLVNIKIAGKWMFTPLKMYL